MPVTSTSKILQAPGDTLTVPLVNLGVGQGSFSCSLMFLTGSFTNAVFNVFGISFGANPVPIPLTPNLLTANGEVTTPSPIGPLTSATSPVVNSNIGYGFSIVTGLFKQIQVVLVSIGSGTVTATIENVSYP
jgi:hypothetical protein